MAEIFPETPLAGEIKDLRSFAEAFVERHGEALDRLMDRLAVEIDLASSTREVDELLATLGPPQWRSDARREVLINYLGFPFWDVLTFPVTSTAPSPQAGER